VDLVAVDGELPVVDVLALHWPAVGEPDRFGVLDLKEACLPYSTIPEVVSGDRDTCVFAILQERPWQ
jgi:hypothetical protein